MKQSALVLFFLLILGTQQVEARISFGKSEKLKVVHDFPNTEDYMSNPGRFMDLGIKYETFNFVGMPIWVIEDPIIVGLENHNTEVYFDLKPEDINSLIAEHNLDKKKLLELSFLNKHLGLVVAITAFILYVLYCYFIKKDDEETDPENIENVNPDVSS